MKISIFLALFFALILDCNAASATWSANPVSGDWNTAANWTPATVPNGPGDTATFGASNTTAISLSDIDEINGIVYNQGASSFTTTIHTGSYPSISGVGITNNSGQMQNFILTTDRDVNGVNSGIFFLNSATAGVDTNFIVDGGTASDFIGAFVTFQDTSSAGEAFFTVNAAHSHGASPAEIIFEDASTAANSTFVCNNPFRQPAGGISFFPSARVDNANFVLNGGSSVGVFTSSLIGNAVFVVNGDSVSHGSFQSAAFVGGVTVGTASFTTNGGTASGAIGGYTSFYSNSEAGNSTIVANGGTNGGLGGEVQFLEAATAATARVEIFGNATCDISDHDTPGITFGSLEGDGLLFLGGNNLVLGGSNLSTTFSGVTQDGGAGGGTGGSITKLGTGTLTLSGASSYTGGTAVSAGTLLVKNTIGSATGSGTVQVSGGILGGKGIITGATTIGTGSGAGGILQPGKGASTATTLTIQNTLTFESDGTYTWKLNTKKAKADKVVANGVTIEDGAEFDSNAVGNKKLTAGKVFTGISNTAATPITGAFANLADGSTVTVGVNKLQVSYSGGDGNDLTLTAVP